MTQLETEIDPLANLNFRYPLRKYQREILELVNIKLERGEKQLHIVAPPGAGKTIIGLQIISKFKQPALIMCPNTTIQSQWSDKLELFLPPDMVSTNVQHLIGTHEDKPLKPITVLTYQVLSTPGKEQEYLDKLAHQLWVEEMTRGLNLSAGEAELRILELMQNNKRAYSKEMSRHSSKLRRKLTEVLDLNEVLHGNALQLLQALRRQRFGLVLFDECHHLTDYWAAVMTHLAGRLNDPVIIGLTGTPPEGKSSSQETRYLTLVGDIDYQVPTPALVREGGLAPFQDLVYFVTPTEKEMTFLESQHEEFHSALEQITTAALPSDDDSLAAEASGLTHEAAPLTKWIRQRLLALPKGGWDAFADKHADMATAIGRYLWKYKLEIPPEIDLTDLLNEPPTIDDWMVLIEDFALHGLKTSSEKSDHELYDRLKVSVRKLGYGLTEQGLRKMASPVDRVLAYSESKSHAVASILEAEYSILQDRLRAIVVTDYERMAATAIKTVKGVLDEESGGAIAVLRELLKTPISELLNPTMVTGSLLLIDKRISQQFVEAAEKWLEEEGYSFKLIVRQDEAYSFAEITAGSADWETRLYVGMCTQLFERGITKCLIGTRGIFGEGWDSQCLNTLIDLTTATSPVSVKQLRGRSIRLNTNDPLIARKVANNWDVVSIAPALEKGLNDFERFIRKHQGYFGISDDGQIESGPSHVHPALTTLSAAEVFASSEDFNEEMLKRALVRDQIYDLWKVGQPYRNQSLGCVELSSLRKIALTPPYIRKDMDYKTHARQFRSALNGVWLEYGGISIVLSTVMFLLLHSSVLAMGVASIPIGSALWFGRKKYWGLYKRFQSETVEPNTQESSLTDIAIAVLTSLQQLKLMPRHIDRTSLKVTVRANGSYRVYLDNVDPEQSQYFASAFKEVMAPLVNQPFIIPKYEYSLPKPRKGETADDAFFRNYLSGKCEARIGSYHAVPKLIARTDKGREIFQNAWNKYVSPGEITPTETKPDLVKKHYGIGPSLAERLLWE
jgi:superfamily II DNA or RNA helicase